MGDTRGTVGIPVLLPAIALSMLSALVSSLYLGAPWQQAWGWPGGGG